MWIWGSNPEVTELRCFCAAENQKRTPDASHGSKKKKNQQQQQKNENEIE